MRSNDTIAAIAHLGVGAGVFGDDKEVVGREVQRELCEAPLLDELGVEVVAELRVVESDERAVLDEAVGGQCVVAGIVECAWDFSDVALHTPAPVHGAALVVVVNHLLHVAACLVDDFVAVAEVELVVPLQTSVAHLEAETASELGQR